jgi:hypothetical protein
VSIDGVERVMDGQVHHGQRATDEDRVLPAGHGDVKTGDIPVVDLVGPDQRPGTGDRQPEYAADE